MQFVIETGRPIAELARDLEPHEDPESNRVNQWKRDNPEPEKAWSPVERARVAEIEEEIRKLRMGNGFLINAPRPSSPRLRT